MHDGAVFGGVLDDAGDTDADAQQPFGYGGFGREDLGDTVADVPGDDVGVVDLRGQRAFGAGEFGESQVEQLDADAGFADVHADHLAAVRGHAQKGTGAAAVGVDAAGLLDQAVGDEVGDDVADGPGAESGDRAQLEPAERAVEVQPLQHGRTVAPPQVAHRAPVPPRHVSPSETQPDLQHTSRDGPGATRCRLLSHAVSYVRGG